MFNFLSSYDSENDEEDETEDKNEVAGKKIAQNGKNIGEDDDDDEERSDDDDDDGAYGGPNSILRRHITSDRVAEAQRAAALKAFEHKTAKLENEPLGLLVESPEFRPNDDGEDGSAASGEEGEMQGSEGKSSRTGEQEEASPAVGFRDSSTASAAGGSVSVASAESSTGLDAAAVPEKKPRMELGEPGENDEKPDEQASTEAPTTAPDGDNHIDGVEVDLTAGAEQPDDEEASALARSMIGRTNSDIELPPEPPGQCSRQLQDRITDLLAYTKRSGLSFVDHAERSKSFRNPSIYEKLVQFCKIDENGTNFPPEIYNPYIWGKESFYEELNKVQRQDMERREKERKGGGGGGSAAKCGHDASAMLGNLDERERKKSKWDSATATTTTSRPVVQVLTGTAKVIPATGALLSSSSSSASKHHHHSHHHHHDHR